LNIQSLFSFLRANRKVLDGMLGFAAGDMIYVGVEELIPAAQLEKIPISPPWVPWPDSPS
jgi:zinc transporter ZupT